jgi:uncharacterized RmlC-like cupin family protein
LGDSVRRIAPEERIEGAATAGMIREEAVVTDRVWAGLVRTDPCMVSGWHHHGAYETIIVVQSGQVKMESGPGGKEVVEGRPGDFLFVPRGTVHRESNPTEEESRAVVVRSGSGPPVVNVQGPADA